MKLHTKIMFSLVGCLIVVVALAQAVQYVGTMGKIKKFSDTYHDLLQTREIEHAQDIYRSVDGAVSGSLKRGEMEKFNHLLEDQKQIEGLLEFSLFSRDGIVTHSSDNQYIGKNLTTEMSQLVAGNSEVVINPKEEYIEILKPEMVTWDCIRCHNSWKEGEIGGISYFRFSTDALRAAEAESRDAISGMRIALFIASIVTMGLTIAVFVVAIIWLLQRFVRQPLDQFVRMLYEFETNEGDLTRRIKIKSKDEIGILARLFNAFIRRLNGVIHRAQIIASNVGEQAANQASRVTQTSAAIKDIADVTRQNSQNAQDARELMKNVSTVVKNGRESMGRLTESMTELSESGSEISNIVKTIETIAFQTNLLALNAAVESARAGEAGQGFAVVASEVRRLALQVSDESNHIRDLIDTTLEKINEGTELVNTSSEMFIETEKKSLHASELVEEIATLSHKQDAGITEVNQVLSQIAEVSNTNARDSEELTKSMSIFKTNAVNSDGRSLPAQDNRMLPS